MVGRSNPGELENFRGLERSCAEDDLPFCAELSRRSLHRTRDAGGSAAVENNSSDNGAGSDSQIWSLSDRREERAGGADALAVLDRFRNVPDALLVYSIEIIATW
jgi:hypothetical protein